MTLTKRGSSLYKAKLARQIEELRQNGETASDHWDNSTYSRCRLSSCRKKLLWFLRSFGLKTGIDFAQFGLELGMVFEGATEVYEHICRWVPNE